ncbi:hypothetical protein BH09ACT12_BH09ACT12_23740 [soil metagenome]
MSRAEQHQRRSSSALVPVLLVVVITGFVVLVATLAASTGPTEVFAGSGPNPNRVSTSMPSDTPTPSVKDDEESDTDRYLRKRSDDSLAWLGTVVRAVLLVLVVVALVIAVIFYARRRRRTVTASRLEEDADPDFDVVDPLAAVASAVVDDADEQDAVLREGTPRNGIVKAWLRFELQAARAGVPRKEWETSTEFTVRLLDSARADPVATSRLAELYRLARFSDHEVTETERADAAAALDRIREHLVARRGERS